MTTFAEFRAQVRRDLEEPSANVWDDSSLMYWTNEVSRDMAARIRQNTDESYRDAIAGTRDYELPAETQEIVAVFYEGLRLSKVTTADVVEQSDDEGTPLYYMRMDEVLRLIPTPSADGQVLIVRKVFPTTITADADEMPFRSERNTCIGYGVLARAFEQTQDWDSSDRFRERYEAALAVFESDAAIADNSDGSSFPQQTY